MGWQRKYWCQDQGLWRKLHRLQKKYEVYEEYVNKMCEMNICVWTFLFSLSNLRPSPISEHFTQMNFCGVLLEHAKKGQQQAPSHVLNYIHRSIQLPVSRGIWNRNSLLLQEFCFSLCTKVRFCVHADVLWIWFVSPWTISVHSNSTDIAMHVHHYPRQQHFRLLKLVIWLVDGLSFLN